MRQLRGILWFIPAAILVSLLLLHVGRPRYERSLEVAADLKTEVGERRPEGEKPEIKQPSDLRIPKSEFRTPASELRNFDPNVLDAAGFVRLGFSPRQAEGILRYRAAIEGFRDISQFADCYVVSEEMFARLEPYITLAPLPEIVVEKPSSDFPAAALRSPVAEKIELNSADSAALVSVSGIGALTASRILAFRAALGGFAKKEQLAEVRGMTRENYERILPQIFVDTAAVQKININFASPQILQGHPYITPEVLRKVVKNRQLKGGWSTTEQLVSDKTLTSEQAARLAPYLTF